jgi:hypothetical protein
MKRARILVRLLALAPGVAASLLALAPADAADTVVPPTNQRVEFALTHADTVAVFNDPWAVSPMCWTMWNNLQLNRVYTPNVTYFSCMIDVTECVRQAVWEQAWSTGVTWVWRDGSGATCNPVW